MAAIFVLVLLSYSTVVLLRENYACTYEITCLSYYINVLIKPSFCLLIQFAEPCLRYGVLASTLKIYRKSLRPRSYQSVAIASPPVRWVFAPLEVTKVSRAIALPLLVRWV